MTVHTVNMYTYICAIYVYCMYAQCVVHTGVHTYNVTCTVAGVPLGMYKSWISSPISFSQKSTPLVAVKTLEHLTRLSSDTQQILTALRCLTRLRLSFMNNQENDSERKWARHMQA